MSDVIVINSRTVQLLWATVDSPWVHNVDTAKFAASFTQLRRFDPSWTFSVHLPPARDHNSHLVQTLLGAPDAPEFVGPDQAALEAMLASFEPA